MVYHPPAAPSMPPTARLPARDRAIAVGVFLGCAALFTLARQHAYWSDGRFLIRFVELGTWRYHHVAYLPLAHALAQLTPPFLGADPEPALFLLSALAAASGCALTFLAARRAGATLPAALVAAAALASAPCAWFYATCIEVHALMLAAAGGVTWWALGTARDPNERRSALPPALALCALAAAHQIGVLWAPALAVLACRTRHGWRRPRHLVPALALVAAFVALWFLVNSASDLGTFVVRRAAREGLAELSALRLVRSFWLAGGPLGVVALALVLHAVLTSRHALRRPLALAGAALLGAFLWPALTLGSSSGGIFLSLLPPAAVVLAHGLSQARARVVVAVALVLLSLQLLLARERVRRWEEDYPGAAWAPALRAELGADGLVLVNDWDDFEAVFRHAGLNTLALIPGGAGHLVDPDSADARIPIFLGTDGKDVDRVRIAIPRSYWENVRPGEEALLVDRFVQRYGTPGPGQRPEYLIFPRRGEPARGRGD